MNISSKENQKKSDSGFFENLDWLTIKEAAIYLRRFKRKKPDEPSAGAVYNLITRYKLRTTKSLGRLYVFKSDLDRHFCAGLR
ncbi:MAG: hypothetical protein CL676_03545 [Bdellovibrionaceae bacterium]|nr:hypothetical protein [Pseudobdellovibrionaceae bacterium]|tara:strand:+ start:284 stop:532 length:249 start_codon:yes stop_codon:yes gene_type:complete